MNRPFSNEELRRYSRHLMLPQIGEAGQLKLKSGSVIVVGAGGLGSPAAMYLAAAGVGRIGLVDFDRVDESNLQRQVLYRTADFARKKVAVAAETLRAMNPHVEIQPYDVRLGAGNALEIFRNYDLVVDGSDNFSTRYLANDAAALMKKPYVYGSVFRFEGQASVFWAGRGPCYRCIFPEPPPPESAPNCAEAGVLGVLPGIIGLVQATEAIKILLGIGEPLLGRMLLYDALAMRFRELRVRRDPKCALCGDAPTITELTEYSLCCAMPVQPAKETAMNEITVEELKTAIDTKKAICLVDVREQKEFDLCRIPTSRLIPLGEIPARFGELDRNADIVMHCKAGGRSAKACEFLAAQGFKKVRNLKGGILAWADRIDPSVPKY